MIMRPRNALLALPIVLGAFGACSSSDTSVRVGISPTIVFPQGLLDNVSKLHLQVFDAGGVGCDTSKGVLTGSGGAIATKDLASSGCPGAAKFCGDVQVDKSDTPRIFLAQAFTAGNTTTPIASGCTKQTVSQDTLQVQIKMLRFAPPATCGGVVSKLPAVQCDPPGDAADTVCDPTCQTRELFLSAGDGATTSSARAKVRPSFVWPAGTGAAGHFVAFFGDKSPGTRTQVSMRVMADDMHTTGDLGVGVQTQSYFLPNNGTGSFPPPGEANSQNNPSAVFLNGLYYVAFDNNAAGPSAINLRTLDSPVKSKQGPGSPAKVSDPGAAMLQPSMAASGDGKLFVAWQSNGSILGRTVDASSLALGTQQTLGTGQNVVVAGMPTGWVIAYESGSDVKTQVVDGAGAGKGEQKVNDATHSGPQQHPGIGSLPDGRFAIDWIDSGAPGGAGVFVQRFGADAKPSAKDQAVRINSTQGDQSSTAMSGSSAAVGGFFTAAWVDNATGHVRARFLGGSAGFGFNSVSGQNDDFQVSQADGRARSNPVIAVGGAGPALVIGWQDDTTTLTDPNFPGIWARRFPLPQ